MARFGDKCESRSEELHTALCEAGMHVAPKARSWNHALKITDPDTGKHIANAYFTQKYSVDPVNIRIKHAGMSHNSEGNWEAKQHRLNPYDDFTWAGRNYKLIASAVNAVLKFRSCIPTKDDATEVMLDEKCRDAYNNVNYRQRAFKESFSITNLKAILDNDSTCGLDLKAAREHLLALRVADRKYDEAVENRAEFQIRCEACEAECDPSELNDDGACETCVSKGAA